MEVVIEIRVADTMFSIHLSQGVPLVLRLSNVDSQLKCPSMRRSAHLQQQQQHICKNYFFQIFEPGIPSPPNISTIPFYQNDKENFSLHIMTKIGESNETDFLFLEYYLVF